METGGTSIQDRRLLLRCAEWISKARGKIHNTQLLVQVLERALKLVESPRQEIFKEGQKVTSSLRLLGRFLLAVKKCLPITLFLSLATPTAPEYLDSPHNQFLFV